MEHTTELLTVRDAAERRRSIRAFSPEPMAEGDLEEILRLTSLAPSAFNLQPWRFVAVRSESMKRGLGEAAFNQRQVRSAPVVLVLYTDMVDALERMDEALHPGMDDEKRASAKRGVLRSFERKSVAEREAWGAEQGNIALGYLLLVAESFGYQTSAMLGFDVAAVRKLLGLPDHVRIPALVAIGHGVEAGFPHHRHALERILKVA